MTTTATEALDAPFDASAAWTSRDLADQPGWVYRFTQVQIAEVEAAVRTVRERGIPLLRVGRDEFPLPTLADQLRQVADDIEHGRGFAVISGIPAARYSEADLRLVFWGLGQHLGVPVSQDMTGRMLSHVQSPGGSDFTGRLPFHTDGSDVVGLLALTRGTRTALASAAAIHAELVARAPMLAARLHRTYHFDRWGTQPAGELPYYTAPLLGRRDGQMSFRYGRCDIEAAQRFPEVPRLQPDDFELFDLIDEIANSAEFRADVELEVGDIQLVNNHGVLHAPARHGHPVEPQMLRLWLTLRGSEGASGRGGIAPVDVIAEAAARQPSRPDRCPGRDWPAQQRTACAGPPQHRRALT